MTERVPNMGTTAIAADLRSVAQQFFAVPEVNRVDISVDGDLVRVWIGINRFGEVELHSRIYEIERRVFKDYPKMEFEFSVTPADEADYGDVTTFRRAK